MDPFYGEIRAFATTTYLPEDWLECDGTAYPITAPYNVLYSLIGNRYGDNGANTFRVPDLRGYIPYGAGTNSTGGYYVIGRSYGAESYAIADVNVPLHTHQAMFTPIQPTPLSVSIQVADNVTPGVRSPVNAYLNNSDSSVNTYAPASTTPAGTLGGTSITVQPGAATVSVAAAGMSPVTPYSAMPSFLVVRFGIAYANGLYPVRP